MSRNDGANTPPPARGVRVFVSSTFRDMAEERDELVKRVFPGLRHRCEARGATWSEVDLRWGVTDEQKADGDVLPICLREIELCRPFFIGLLGERYGWIPPELPEDIVRQHSWLEQRRGRSVTELEMLYGVLQDSVRAGDAFFYLRDPAWLEQLSPEQRPDFVDSEPESRRKLAELKERVRSSGLPVRVYDDPQHLAELVAADFARVIDRRFPEGQAVDELAQSDREHDAYARTRFDLWVGREEDLAALDGHAADPDCPPLVISGGSGTGKSALAANWLRRLADAEPERLVLAHYSGASPRSAEWTTVAVRLIRSLSRRLALGVTAPCEPSELPGALARTLALAGEARPGPAPCVVLLDGVDQITVDEGDLPLHWLPDAAPPGVCLVVTAKPSPALRELVARGWARHELPELPSSLIRSLAGTYLAKFAKALSAAQLDRIAAAPQASNALFLLVLLDELRHHGDHFTLDALIDRLLETATVDDLFEQVLGRWERDYERDHPGLVRSAFTALRAGRRGLEEGELLAMLGEGEPLPRAVWSPLFLAAERSLMLRDGRLTLAHDYLRQAIDDRYLAGGSPSRGGPLARVHSRLADAFAKQPLSPRVLSELPWQLAGAHRWDELAALLVRADVCELAHELDEHLLELRQLWTRLEAESRHTLAGAFAPLLEDEGASVRHRSIAAALLNLSGAYRELRVLQRSLIRQLRASGHRSNLLASLTTLASALATLGEVEEAAAALDEAEPLARELGNPELLAHALRTRSRLAVARQAWDEALAVAGEVERLHRARSDSHDLQMAIEDRARLLTQLERLDEAMEALEQQRAITDDLGDPVARAANAGARADVELRRGHFQAAVALQEEQVTIYEQVGDRTNLARVHAALSYSLEMLGRPEPAREHLRASDRIAAAAALDWQLAWNRYALARLQRSTGDWSGALSTTEEVLGLARSGEDEGLLEQGLGLRGELLRMLDDLPGAIAAHREAMELARRNQGPRGVALALLNLGEDLLMAGDLAAAGELLDDAEARLREQGDASNLQVVLGVQARRALAEGDPLRALATSERQLALSREAGVATGMGNALGNIGYIKASMLGDAEGALAAFREQAELARASGEPYMLGNSLWNQAGIAAFLNDRPAAEALWRETLSVLGSAGLYVELRDKLADLPPVALSLGALDVALDAWEQLAGVQRRLGDPGASQLALEQGGLLALAHGRLERARALLDAQLASCRAAGAVRGMITAAGNLAIATYKLGDPKAALALVDEALRWVAEQMPEARPLWLLANRGELLVATGRREEGLVLLEEAAQAADRGGDGAMAGQIRSLAAGL